jgi:hypothetical protein
LKLLLDEMWPPAIAEALRERGHDVVAAHGVLDVRVNVSAHSVCGGRREAHRRRSAAGHPPHIAHRGATRYRFVPNRARASARIAAPRFAVWSLVSSVEELASLAGDHVVVGTRLSPESGEGASRCPGGRSTRERPSKSASRASGCSFA